MAFNFENCPGVFAVVASSDSAAVSSKLTCPVVHPKLYGVPRSSINADLVELVGGANPLATRARQKVSAGKPLEALHLLDIALAVEPQHTDALTVKKDALNALLAQSGGNNLSEVMWLKSEIAAVEAALNDSAQS